MTDFEILLVSIDWERPDKHFSIIKGAKPLELNQTKDEKGRENIYECDIVMYTKEDENFFQFCVKTSYTPYLVLDNNGEKSYPKLHNIEQDLWIIKDEWRIGQRGKGYHYCPSINTQGRLNLIITKEGKKSDYLVEIDVNNSIKDFDFEQLKSDFEGELWGLLTTDKARVNTSKAEVGNFIKKISFAENKLIEKFLALYDKISKNPKVELQSALAEERFGKVKPLSETYKKIARKGFGNAMPSRSVAENIDIYENRYVCLMLYRVFLIVKNNVTNLEKQIKKQTADIELKRETIINLEQPFIEVDGDLLKFEIDQYKSQFESWKKNWEVCRNDFEKRNTTTEGEFKYAKLLLKGTQVRGRISHVWASCWWRKENGSHYEGEYCVFEFEGDVSNIFESDKDLAVELAVSYDKQIYNSAAGREWNKYVVKSIKKGSLKYGASKLEKIVKTQEEKYRKLKESNWRKLLDNQEIAERNNQVQTLNRDIKRLEKQHDDLSDFILEQIDLLPVLEQRMKEKYFTSVKWNELKKVVPSMTFIQNAAYRNTLEKYNKILKSEGISFEVFDLYERVTSYGVREMPQVYELWSLVSIIKTLKESYHLKYNLNEINTLLKTINPKNRSHNSGRELVFNFIGKLKSRDIRLFYQRTLPNNKRPDFILEIASKGSVVNLILDSKFKNYNYKKSLNYEIQDLCSKYSSPNNFVFVLHPCNDLMWQDIGIKMTNYGGEHITPTDSGVGFIFPFHQYGYLTLKPGKVDNLKKILDLGFEYLIEPDRNAKRNGLIDPKPQHDLICINCGGEQVNLMRKVRGEEGKQQVRYHYSAICQNNECGHQAYIDYCWECTTVLYKHGYTWDYHKTSVWSPYDIHCPNCGVTVAERPS